MASSADPDVERVDGLLAPDGAGEQSTQGARILIIEDEPGIVDFVRRGLEAEGFAVASALDGLEGEQLALNGSFPALDNVHLTDFKVRILDSNRGTGAITRVLIDSADHEGAWTTIGVDENIIEASWKALLDSIHYGLLRAEMRASHAD